MPVKFNGRGGDIDPIKKLGGNVRHLRAQTKSDSNHNSQCIKVWLSRRSQTYKPCKAGSGNKGQDSQILEINLAHFYNFLPASVGLFFLLILPDVHSAFLSFYLQNTTLQQTQVYGW